MTMVQRMHSIPSRVGCERDGKKGRLRTWLHCRRGRGARRWWPCARPWASPHASARTRTAASHLRTSTITYISQSRRIGTNQANDIPAATELAPPKLIPRTVPAAAAAPPLLASTLADATNPMAWTAKGLKRRGARGYEGAEAIGGEERGRFGRRKRERLFLMGVSAGAGNLSTGRLLQVAGRGQCKCSTTTAPPERA